MEAFFKDAKIKVFLRDSSKIPKTDVMLLDLTTGIFYRIDHKNKEYKSEHITDRHPVFIPAVSPIENEKKIILGYSCSAYKGYDSSKTGYPEPPPTIITSWYADSLYFRFDKKFASSEMISVFGDGDKIAMGFLINMTVAGKPIQLFSSPVTVEETMLSDSMFAIPFDYIHLNYQKEKEYTVTADSVAHKDWATVDSTKKTIDSGEKKAKKLALEPGQVQSKKSPSKNTHTPSTKSPAIKPKE